MLAPRRYLICPTLPLSEKIQLSHLCNVSGLRNLIIRVLSAGEVTVVSVFSLHDSFFIVKSTITRRQGFN